MSDYAAPPGKEFYFKTHDNRIVGIARSLREFRDLLRDLHTDAVMFHLRDNRNDFEVWIRSVFRDDALADRIKHIKELSGAPESIKQKLCEVVSGKIEG